MHPRLPLLLALLPSLTLAPATAVGQQARWLDPTVTLEVAPTAEPTLAPSDARHLDTPSPLEERAVSVQDLAGPLDYNDIVALNRVAASAVVPVRATFRRDALLDPNVVYVDGVATLVARNDGPPVLVTAFALVDGASAVETLWQGEPITVDVSADARFGLALLAPRQPLADPPRALSLLPVGPATRVETFSTLEGSAGAAVGASAEHYGYYQLSTLGVTLGYPLINRRGELVGVGSHRYPVNPAYALAVPAGAVAEFLEALEPVD
jgi:hypothetical protein